jgi:16S rRNA (uracil1498-N3)-methyltransferase
MNSPRFHCPDGLAPGARFDLPADVARHAVRVLRLQSGAAITLFDGRGGEHAATIERIERERVAVQVGAWLAVERESTLQLTLVQAIQAADKMDYTIQKAVELGVAAMQPVASRRSVVRLQGERETRRLQHWQSVAIAACGQCGRNRIPPVAAPVTLEAWLAQPPTAGVLRLMLAPGAPVRLADLVPPTRIELLVGAEGGLDEREVDAALRAGFAAVRLGPRVLRTETAGLAALAAIQTLWGDFRGD